MSGMALALLQRIFLMSSLMLLLVWLIFFMVLIKLLPILGTISGKTVKLMVLALICLGNNRQD
ncbi:minor spike H domain protein [Klebsiella pneumoniae]|nr:minor spike H domain protein [Klebsiella pneumoniae]